MALIAFRPEYQITVEADRNRIFYKPYAALLHAQALPHYLADWQLALASVQPGFTILTDITQHPAPNPTLMDSYVAAQQLIVRAGVRYVAEVHHPEATTEQASTAVSTRSAMPVRHFTDLWAADQFLDSL